MALITFDSMKALTYIKQFDGEDIAGDSVCVQRLSTSSYVTGTDNTVADLTHWCWYLYAADNTWLLYQPVSTTVEGNVLLNDTLNTFVFGYIASDIWYRTIQIAREETCCCCHYLGCSFRLAARVILYAPSNIQDSTYHGLCYTSRGALAGKPNGV